VWWTCPASVLAELVGVLRGGPQHGVVGRQCRVLPARRNRFTVLAPVVGSQRGTPFAAIDLISPALAWQRFPTSVAVHLGGIDLPSRLRGRTSLASPTTAGRRRLAGVPRRCPARGSSSSSTSQPRTGTTGHRGRADRPRSGPKVPAARPGRHRTGIRGVGYCAGWCGPTRSSCRRRHPGRCGLRRGRSHGPGPR
jgi:hypothetical protein